MTAPSADPSAAGGSIETVRSELERSSGTATTMSFVVWIDQASHREWVLERVAKLSEKHPARTIVFDACEHAPAAQLVRTGRPTADDGTQPSDLVLIGSHGMTPETVADTVQQLLAPDVPAVLWWTGDDLSNASPLGALLDVVDALVVDSSGTRGDDATVVKLAAFLPEHPAVAWGDLAWMRLRPWQDTIAQFFDAETLQKELFSIRSLAIISGSDAEALYLAGWLASRLRWTAVPGGTFTDSNGQPVAFTHERSGPLRRVRSVEITTAASHYFAMVSADDEGVVTLRAEGEGARAERLVPLQAIDNASLLERAILEPATNEVFETALRMVGTLLQ